MMKKTILRILKESVELSIRKNMEPAGYFGSKFGQDVEPHGTYVTQDDYPNQPETIENWVKGKAYLKKPLYIDINYDTQIEYKRDLSKKHKAKGKQLTNKLMKLGYDAIITVHEGGYYGEIVLFPNSKFMLDKLPNDNKFSR